MKDFEDKNLIEIEQKIKTQFDEIELEPAEETLAAIRPNLKKKRRRSYFKSHAFMTRLVAVATSILLLFGIGLTAWLLWPKGDNPPDYRYEDLDIELKPCEKSVIFNYVGLYVPDLDLLAIDEVYNVGIHKESLETVYFIVEGMNVDIENGTARKITLTIILQKKYEFTREDDYNSDSKKTVAGTEISILKGVLDPPFYNYKLGFTKGDVRYYIDYQTTSANESDVESFMTLFLK